jgi:hypothetical protein
VSARVAACSCGQLRVTVAGEPVRISVCHCLECQKRTGSVFAVQARFPRTQMTIEGAMTQWTRRGDDGGSATFSFCPTCGSTVFYELAQQPDIIAVAVGAFADPTFPAPRVSVYEERQHPWTRDMAALLMERHF